MLMCDKIIQKFDWQHPTIPISIQSTTPVQALKYCARPLRRRSQYLPFALAFASTKAGYESFPVPCSTYRQTGLLVFLFLYFEIASYTHSPSSLHNLLLLLHFHVHSLLPHNTLPTRKIITLAYFFTRFFYYFVYFFIYYYSSIFC